MGGPEIKPGEAPGLVAQRGEFDEPVRNRLAECQMVSHLLEHDSLGFRALMEASRRLVNCAL